LPQPDGRTAQKNSPSATFRRRRFIPGTRIFLNIFGCTLAAINRSLG
jgi:hypothetical protein